jgi:ribosomal protein L11 methyltransferase
MNVWHELTIWTANEAVEMVANFLHERGAGGVVIEESGSLNRDRDTSLGQWYELPLNDIPEGQAVVQAYFAGEEDAKAAEAGIRALLDELAGYPIETGPGKTGIRIVKEEDWANGWKQFFKPVRISERLVVKPSWEQYEARPGEIVLELDPGMAFGTGTHATTSLCLRALEKNVRPGMTVIDVGTGSGILSIAAVRLGARRVLALDLDPVAVKSAAENVAMGGLSDRIDVQESDLLQAVRDGRAKDVLPADLVVANLLAEIVLTFVPDVYQALAAGGIYITSGIIGRKANDVRQALEAAGFRIAAVDAEDDWVAITAVKPG